MRKRAITQFQNIKWNGRLKHNLQKNQVTPEFRKSRSQIMQDLWRDPVFRAKQDLHKETRAQAQRSRWQNPEYRAQVTAARRNNAGKIALQKMQSTLRETMGQHAR